MTERRALRRPEMLRCGLTPPTHLITERRFRGVLRPMHTVWPADIRQEFAGTSTGVYVCSRTCERCYLGWDLRRFVTLPQQIGRECLKFLQRPAEALNDRIAGLPFTWEAQLHMRATSFTCFLPPVPVLVLCWLSAVSVNVSSNSAACRS